MVDIGSGADFFRVGWQSFPQVARAEAIPSQPQVAANQNGLVQCSEAMEEARGPRKRNNLAAQRARGGLRL